MHCEADSLDDLLYEVFERLLEVEANVNPTKGKNSEIFGALLTLNNPKARLSITESKGKAFSALGELLWYLSGSSKLEPIQFYIPKYKDFSDDGINIHGAYGPRLIKMGGKVNQITRIIDLLQNKPNTRRAVIQLFHYTDLNENFKDIPCTTTLQFVNRDQKLHCMVSMRSNDAYLGLQHDIFCFTMIQEIIAKELGLSLGTYIHSVGSLHLYEKNKNNAKEYLQEGRQSTKFAMKGMTSSPLDNFDKLLRLEQSIRLNLKIDEKEINLPTYWYDLFLMLKIHFILKNNLNLTEEIMNQISDRTLKHYASEKNRKQKYTA